MLIVEGEREASEVQLIISADGFEVVLFEVLLKEEVLGLHNLQHVLLVVKLRVGAEEIFDPAGGQRQDGESFSLVEFNVADGQWDGELGVGGSDDGVEVLEDFLDGNGEG